MKYLLTITIDADNVTAAEDAAADILSHVNGYKHRSALHYMDPITGQYKLWSEPAMRADELIVHRDRS
jgi:hypothetical protein